MTTNTNTIHAFENAGLGKAPFHVVGVEERRGPYRPIDPATGQWDGCTEIGAPGQPMGSCKFCGTGIAVCWLIKSADGQQFIVGSDCVRKTGDAGLLKRVQSFEAAQRREAATRRKARDEARVNAAVAMLPEAREVLSGQPHPKLPGRTLLDYVEWCLANAGAGGRVKVAAIIERALG